MSERQAMAKNVPRHAVGIVLAGGQGTRLHGLCPDLPKPMIPRCGKPFLEWVIRYLAAQGIARFVVSLGHLAANGEAYFRSQSPGLANVEFVREPVPYGTGGGLRLAWQTTPGRDAVVANGDTLLLADLAPAFAVFDRPDVDAVVLAIHRKDTDRYGTLTTDSCGRLIGFMEKRVGAGLVNAGVYLLKARLLERFGLNTPLSIENDVFPRWLWDGIDVRVHACEAPFIDIGTPETFESAELFLKTHWQTLAIP